MIIVERNLIIFSHLTCYKDDVGCSESCENEMRLQENVKQMQNQNENG